MQPAVLQIQLPLRLMPWSLKSFSDHLLCAQECARHRQYREEGEGLPALESAQAGGHNLDSKTNIAVLCSVLGCQNLRATNTKLQHIWVAVGAFSLLASLAV